jgi:uncharacterized protein (TIGR00369 family)
MPSGSQTGPLASEPWRERPRGGYPDPAAFGLSGRDRLTRLSRGGAPAPPLSRLTGARLAQVGAGTAGAEMPASGWLLNPAGVIGGGTLAILADVALGCSVETELPAATPYTTAELSLTFLRPVHPPRRMTAGGQAIHVGGSVALSEAFVIEEEGERLVAQSTSRCAILPRLDPLPDPAAEPPAVEPDPDEASDPYRRPPPDGLVIPQHVWDRLSGAEILERQLRGELPSPPITHLTGIRPVDFGDGTSTVTLPCSEWLASPLRTVQGGVIAMLADTAMLIAVMTTTPPATAMAGLDLKVNYLRPVLPDGRELTARALVIHAGRQLAVARATIDNADGKPVALATGSAMYLPGRPASLGEVELAVEEGLDLSAQ